MVQTMPAESGGKSWLKEISMGERVFRRIFPATDEPHQQKNAASPRGSGVLFDHDTQRGIALSLAGLAATYSPRA
jgi:hypothetical protein